ncbi:MAG TPA: HAMP domain-containing sensor histidine kinase, partial [Planctomycetota bacterium]|nr:HAMP domain-containing sensor histidine kinase [Planctomycetota bacterium]
LQRCAQRRQLPAYERARAAFRLGGVLRQLGDADAAEDAWLDARLAALESDASPIGIDLLTRLAIAELRGDHTRLAELAREIAANTWFAVPDELTGAVFARALAALAAAGNGSGPDPGWADLRAREEARRSARRFAAEFDRFAAPALQRVLDDAPTGPVFRSIGNGSECSLLALRPTTAEEQAAAGRGARWLGLRFDLAGLVTEALDELLDPGKDGYRLAVFDPDDEPIVGGPLPDGASAPELPALGGLILRAVPVDPEAILRDERLAVRNRVLILTALLALALGSGLLLVRSVAREAELAKLKVEFVSRMSHELKTPLALIRMYGETLALGRAAGPEQTAQFGGIVAREADRLTGQIDRILAFSQQQSGTLRYAPRPADLRALVADVLARYRDHVEQHGCTLVAEVDGDPLPVAVDANAFHLALAGLIENSVKYTAAGEPDREIVVTVGRAGDAAEVAVHDRGIGIPEGERERVFEAFYRPSNAGEVRGAGLGLAQVRHFAHAHGGEVVALARDGGGTTLRLRLPLQPAGEESPDPT